MNFKNLLIFDPHLSDTEQIFAQAAAERRENLPNIVLKTRIIKSNIGKKRRDKVKRHIKKPMPMPTSAKARISPPAAASKNRKPITPQISEYKISSKNTAYRVRLKLLRIARKIS